MGEQRICLFTLNILENPRHPFTVCKQRLCPLEMCLVKKDRTTLLVNLCHLTHFVQHAMTTSPLKNATGIFFNHAANSEIPDNARGVGVSI